MQKIINVIVWVVIGGLLLWGTSAMLASSERIKEQQGAEQAQWVAENELSNDDIIRLARPCLENGLDFELVKHHLGYNYSINTGVTCTSFKVTQPQQDQGMTADDLDAQTISVPEYIGLKLIGF